MKRIIDTLTGKPVADGALRYDYDRQAWVRLDPNGVVYIEECGHPRPFDHCYACEHGGAAIVLGDESKGDPLKGIQPEVEWR